MDTVRAVVNLGRALRKKNELRVRQPLGLVTVISRDPGLREAVTSHGELIAEELNVRRVEVRDDESDLVRLSAKADFGRLGPRLGAGTKEVAAAIADLDHETVTALLDGATVTVSGEVVTLDDIVVARAPHEGTVVAASGPVTVAIDIEVTDELRVEGVAREIVNRLQTMRRDLGLDVTDRIAVSWSAEDAVIGEAFGVHGALIGSEVLAISITETEVDGEITDIDGRRVYLTITLNK
jgi:isoleucyl-tRNA synthetase